MYFKKNEVIHLSSGKKHIVVETMKYNDIYYYYVCEVDDSKNRILDSFKIITTVSENNYLFIKTINGDLENVLTPIFKEKLGII